MGVGGVTRIRKLELLPGSTAMETVSFSQRNCPKKKRVGKEVNLNYFFHPILIFLPVLSFGKLSWRAADMDIWAAYRSQPSYSEEQSRERAKNGLKKK